MKPDEVKTGLPPIARPDARLFILGSLPGDASLAAGRYYAHPTNQFWRLLGSVLGRDLHSLQYEDRLAAIQRERIGLWDVIATAFRRGSLDQAIRSAAHNRIGHLLGDFASLEAIAFNGATASVIGRRLIGEVPPHLTLIDLPSSSAANTRPLTEKTAEWGRLKPFLQP